MVGPSESKGKASGSTPDSKANRVVVTKASSSGKPSNRVVIGSLPEAITPSRLKELLQGIGPIQVQEDVLCKMSICGVTCSYISILFIAGPFFCISQIMILNLVPRAFSGLVSKRNSWMKNFGNCEVFCQPLSAISSCYF